MSSTAVFESQCLFAGGTVTKRTSGNILYPQDLCGPLLVEVWSDPAGRCKDFDPAKLCSRIQSNSHEKAMQMRPVQVVRKSPCIGSIEDGHTVAVSAFAGPKQSCSNFFSDILNAFSVHSISVTIRYSSATGSRDLES